MINYNLPLQFNLPGCCFCCWKVSTAARLVVCINWEERRRRRGEKTEGEGKEEGRGGKRRGEGGQGGGREGGEVTAGKCVICAADRQPEN